MRVSPASTKWDFKVPYVHRTPLDEEVRFTANRFATTPLVCGLQSRLSSPRKRRFLVRAWDY